jgi:crotonobetaine/carnitine-CoA ligase
MKRFNVAELHAAYGSTEVSGPIVRHPDDELVWGYCGRARTGFEVRLVDEHDVEVPVGEMGEVVVRTDQPWMLTSGYVDNPDANAAAWRNGWFHTGDAMRRDEAGRFFFMDRLKDAVRRRGENISSFEVEAEVVAFPGVSEVACVPHREPDGVEDEVKVWLVPEEGAAVDFDELLRFCAERMPYFMVPRYIELATSLPKTPSERVKKHLLRQQGNGPAAWDREEHGYRMTRDGLTRASK